MPTNCCAVIVDENKSRLMLFPRVVEQNIESSVESRNEALGGLRELGPPDLVHLIRQSVKSTRQVGCVTESGGTWR